MIRHLFPLSALLLLLMGPNAFSATVSYSDDRNVVSSGLTGFTFNQFDSSLGTLTAVDLLISSSAPSGNMTVTNTDASNTANVVGISSALNFLSGTGHSGYAGSSTTLSTSPNSSFYTIPALGSQLFEVNSGQSLIGGTTQTISINSANFASYIGLGTVTFNAFATVNVNTFGATYSVNSSSYFSATEASLRYTYTPAGPVPVPEPGQVAASLLLLGGIGAYVFLKRRKKTATTAA